MPTQLLSLGYPQLVLQNVVYALPARRAHLYAPTGTWEQSNDGTNFTAITFADNQAEVIGAFIRNTAGNALVTLKAD